MATILHNGSITVSSDLPLQDRLAIVTGASRGIGRAIALHLASLGAKVVISDISNKDQADFLATQINSSFPGSSSQRALTAQADVSDPSQVKSLFDVAEQFFNSRPYILVNSAGVSTHKNTPIADISTEEFDRILRGAFLCAKEAANRLKRGGGGRIILISSSMAASLRPGKAVYAASKAAVDAMVKILAKELKGTGITANCVSPGPIATDLFFAGKTAEMVQRVVDECPFGRLGQVVDVAPIVGFLASDSSEWINGQVRSGHSCKWWLYLILMFDADA